MEKPGVRLTAYGARRIEHGVNVKAESSKLKVFATILRFPVSPSDFS